MKNTNFLEYFSFSYSNRIITVELRFQLILFDKQPDNLINWEVNMFPFSF